jgi:GNAT superfamily N-acetyltransferase
MAEDIPTSANGSPIDIHPIRRDELGKVLLRCLPDGYRIEMLFKTQDTIGFGAWDQGQCIAQLHCYRLMLPHGSTDLWPAWSRPAYIADVLAGSLNITGPVWCHACFHVGRSIESFARSDQPDARYFDRGIGTALAQASVEWAKSHDYAAVIAPGTPDGLFAFSVWAGGLPWTTYQKLGFEVEGPDANDELPEWAKDKAPPEVMAEVNAALEARRPKRELHSKLMVLRCNTL